MTVHCLLEKSGHCPFNSQFTDHATSLPDPVLSTQMVKFDVRRIREGNFE